MVLNWIAGSIQRNGRDIPFHWCLDRGRLMVNCAGATKRADRALSGAHEVLAEIIAGELYRNRP